MDIPTTSSDRISLINETVNEPEQEHAEKESDMSVHQDTVQEAGPSLPFETTESAEPVEEITADETAHPHQETGVRESADEEVPAVYEKPVNEEQSLVEERSVDEEPETGVPSEPIKKEPERRKRSHLPFNVLMLKQDKRQMDTRNSSVRPEGSLQWRDKGPLNKQHLPFKRHVLKNLLKTCSAQKKSRLNRCRYKEKKRSRATVN